MLAGLEGVVGCLDVKGGVELQVAVFHNNVFEHFLAGNAAIGVVVDVKKFLAVNLDKEVVFTVGVEWRCRAGR